MKKTRKSLEQMLHEAAVSAGYIPAKALRETIAMLQKDVHSTPATLRKRFAEGPTPFDHLIFSWSKRTQAELSRLRERVRPLESRPPRPVTAPIDPRTAAEADGIVVVRGRFGPEFNCLIEYHTDAKTFVLFYQEEPDGLTRSMRYAIARHLAHYSFYFDELKSGEVENTANLDVDPNLRLKAAEMAEEILVPSELLNREIQRLIHTFDVDHATIRRQASYGATTIPPHAQPAGAHSPKPQSKRGSR